MNEALRLAAAMSEHLAPLALTVWPRVGPALVVSGEPGNHPDLSAGEFRSLVLGSLRGEAVPAGFAWVFDIEDLTVEGVGVSHVGDGVVALERPHAPRWWWPTTLAPDRLPTVVGETAIDLLETGAIAADEVAGAELAIHFDAELGVTVVGFDDGVPQRSRSAARTRRGDRFARALSRSCVVSELLSGSSARASRE